MDLYRALKEFKSRDKRGGTASRVFTNTIEHLIFGSVIVSVLKSTNHLIIYEVENYENLFDYANLFSRVMQAGNYSVLDKNLSIVVVASYPSKIDVESAVDTAIESGMVPIVAYFTADLIAGESSSSETKELMKVVSQALFEKTVYVILFTTNSVVLFDNIPITRYGVVMSDLAPKIIKRELPEKSRYAETVGFSKVITMSSVEIDEYVRRRRLPTPHTISNLERDITFKDLILPVSIKDFLKFNVLNPLKTDFKLVSSILLVGPAGSGKTTISYALANELGVPANLVHVELMSSKWLGESEKLANQTMLMLNDRSPTVAVFRDIDLILGQKKEGEDTAVFERIRAIISSWLRSDRRRFFAVFTLSDPKRVPEYIVQDATFGVFKLPILPPLKASERKTFLIMFLNKLAEKYGLRFDPTKPTVSEGLDTVAEETWAYTPRELQDISQTVVNIVLDKGIKEINKEHIQIAKKYKEIDRISRIEVMRDAINMCKKVGIPETLLVEIYRFEEEIEKLRAKAYVEETKKKSFVKISQ